MSRDLTKLVAHMSDIIKIPTENLCFFDRDVICHISRDITISGFGGHIAVPSCRSLLQSFAGIFVELSMVINLRFAVEISLLSI